MKINLVLFLILIFFSCKEKNAKSNNHEVIKHQPIEIDLSKQVTVHESILSQITDFQFLKLKGIPSNEFIIKVDKVIEHDKKLFVLDEKKSNLFVFTLAGDFLQKIGKRGGGPDEYISINDFVVHKERKEIILLDDRHMLFFDLNGAFKNKVAFKGFYPINMSLLNDNHLIFNVRGVDNNDFYDLIVTDINGEIVTRSSKFPQSGSYLNFAFTGGISDNGMDTYYNLPTSSLIYKIIPPADLLPLYKITFGESTWPESKRFNHQEFDREMRSLNISFLKNYKVMSDWIIFEFLDKNMTPYLYYNIKDQVVYTSKGSNNGLIRFMLPVPVGIDSDNRFINSMEYESFLSFKKTFKSKFIDDFKNFNPDLYAELEKLNFDNSTILTFYRLKTNKH